MTAQRAWTFPVLGSAVLLSLYIVFKLFDKDLVNMLLTSYFLIFASLSLVQTLTPFLSPLFSRVLPSRKNQITFPTVPYFNPDGPQTVIHTLADVVIWVMSGIVIIMYVFTKNWILNNILGLSFSIQGVALFSLGSYKIGCILLGGLFFYDIFWVFGTDVMVTVAKSFDAPIKVLFPKSLWASPLQFSMLGLGDIVVPGVFLALLLRYDYHRYQIQKGGIAKDLTSQKSTGETKTDVHVEYDPSFPKPYFFNTFLGYFFGLGLTVFVMHTFQAAQPALLYLVPACVGFSLTTSVYLNDLTGLLSYSEEEPAEKEKKN
eukprot:TRINITY_DN2984_c0_g1_i1.p1 TRINITY_DN2984_c0_g1~~TRINITY_DN2984_c0_g1_i1.p1  ORF type:complete len:317 (-),score=45.37 TRINITY_DN2984_c0_g1_i1:343-1293(-)